MTDPLEQLTAAEDRDQCAVEWPASGRTYAHRCDLAPGHDGPHVCSCSETVNRLQDAHPAEEVTT